VGKLKRCVRLHIGSGPITIPGWTNADIAPWSGVDHVFDVRGDWPVSDAELVFAEHFIEHLTLEEGLQFLTRCRDALREDGILRLSTPNLDWVWLTHYKRPDALTLDEQLIGCLEINRAFHGWGHRFLYNRRTLDLALRAAGFSSVITRSYGESAVPALRNLERHERHDDLPDAPSVLIVEATGREAPASGLKSQLEPYLRDFAIR
jgi:hypothetical protein